MISDPPRMYELTELGMKVLAPLDYTVWEFVGQNLITMNRGMPWLIGDWLIYGERAWADKYANAVDVTKLDYQTLRNYKWVAGVFEMGRRRVKLTFSHHAAVAALEVKQQELWLNLAEKNQWTVEELRHRLAGGVTGDTGGGSIGGADPLAQVKAAYKKLPQSLRDKFLEWVEGGCP